MKPSILIGFLIGALILAAGVLVPRFRSSEAQTELAAREEAVLAERLLYRYEPLPPNITDMLTPETLKDADLSSHLDAIREDLATAGKQFEQTIRQMKQYAELAQFETPTLTAPRGDEGALKRAVTEYDSALKANTKRLDEAIQHANAAKSSGGSEVLGVAQVAGVAEMTRATNYLSEAQILRSEQQRIQARLLELAARWNAYRATQDYMVGLDVRDILSRLRVELEQIRETQQTAEAEAQELEAQVATRGQELERVMADLGQARDELLALEQRGFTAGDDESFKAYREQYLSVSARLGELQQREHLLRYGGREGATWSDESIATAELEGGEVVVGLEDLQRQLALKQKIAQGFADAVDAMQKHIGFIEQTGETAKQGGDHYAALMQELDAAQKAILPAGAAEGDEDAGGPLKRVLTEAREREEKALQAARSAEAAFRTAKQAASKWVSDARDLQSEKDDQRLNKRLSTIIGDKAATASAEAGRAAALMLQGRILSQRIAGIEALLDDMRIILELRPGASFNTQPFEEQLNTARDNAIKAVEEARKTYEALVRSMAPEQQWIAQIGLATANHMLARIDLANSATLMTQAVQATEEAVRGRELSPFLSAYLPYRQHLRDVTGYVPPAEDSGAVPNTGTEGANEGGGEAGEPTP